MDTTSINKLNRFKYTLDSIVARDYNENHGPDGRFTEGSSSSGSKSNKSAKSAAFKAATKGAAAAKLDKRATEAAQDIALKDLKIDDLESWRDDDADIFENESGSFDINQLKENLRSAYKAGAESNELTDRQIKSEARKFAEKAMGFSLKDTDNDAADMWSNSRASFDKLSLEMAFRHAYTKGNRDK